VTGVQTCALPIYTLTEHLLHSDFEEAANIARDYEKNDDDS
jgi:hypothetical protein